MRCPEHLTKDELWRILGEYASDVGDAEGVLFTDNPYVKEACDQYTNAGVPGLLEKLQAALDAADAAWDEAYEAFAAHKEELKRRGDQ